MFPVKPRSRLVTFRVTEDEYEELRQACLVVGSRSVSELARTALRGIIAASRRREQADQSEKTGQPHVILEQLRAECNYLGYILNQLMAQLAQSSR